MFELAIAERTYSSWSLRGYLLAELTGKPYRTRFAKLRTDAFEALRADNAPARTVPMIRFDDEAGGEALAWDSLALAEELNDRFPEAGIWPAAPRARAAARSISAEMHAGFRALRAQCPMNLERRYSGFPAGDDVIEDAARIETLWAWARETFGQGGPWLFGEAFTAADAIFAPIASRFVTYDLATTKVSRDYMEAIHAHPPFRRWRAMGVAEGAVFEQYEFDHPDKMRFGPHPRPAHAVQEVKPSNDACPYSGKPVAADSLAEIDGKVIGFCNPFCRDKSVADPEAWPKLVPLLP